MFPEVPKRVSVANPVYAVCGPDERPTTLSMGLAFGTTSYSAVKVPVWVGSAVLLQVEVAVLHTVSALRTMLTSFGSGARSPAHPPRALARAIIVPSPRTPALRAPTAP